MTLRESKSAGSHTWYTAKHERQLKRLARPSGPIENVNTVSASGSALTLPDVDVATMHDVTLTANCAITTPTATKGKSFSLRLKQDGTGSRNPSWDSQVKWDGGAEPVWATAAGTVDTAWFACFEDGRWEAGMGGTGHA